MQPLGDAAARPSARPVLPAADEASAGATFDAVAVRVGMLPVLPPNPTAKAITVALPISEIVFVASDFIRFPNLCHGVPKPCRHPWSSWAKPRLGRVLSALN
jgi:hypothetical protein